MPYIVDIYGTRTPSFGSFDSDIFVAGDYNKGDIIYIDGVIYTANSDIAAGTPFTVADSEGVLNAWRESVIGLNSPDGRAGDSEIWTAIANLARENDSDNILTRDEHDSDLIMTYHDFSSADSDIRRLLQDTIDSDIARIYHDYQAADSDFTVRYDSDITTIYHDYQSADSDFRVAYDSDITTIYHDYQAADSDFRKEYDSDIPRIYHDYQAADSEMRRMSDSDIKSIRARMLVLEAEHDSDLLITLAEHDSDLFFLKYNKGRFTLNDSDATGVPKDPGFTWWNNFGNFINSNNFRVYASTGVYSLPWLVSTTSASDLGWTSVTTGPTNPRTIVTSGRALYGNTTDHSIWVWDRAAGGGSWEKVTLKGTKIFLTQLAASADLNWDAGRLFSFFLDLTNTAKGMRLFYDAGPFAGGPTSIPLSTITVYATPANLPSIPPGIVLGGFLAIGYVTSTKQFAYGSKSRQSGDGFYKFQAASPTLFPTEDSYPTNFQQNFRNTGVFEDGATYFDKSTKTLYVREVTPNTAGFTKVASASIEGMSDVVISAKKNGSLLSYDSDSKKWVTVNFNEAELIADDDQVEFEIDSDAVSVTGFYRNGLRLKRSCWSYNDRGMVTYDPLSNSNSPMDANDDVFITYYR